MRQRHNTLFIVLWVTLWLAFVFPALAQDATPEGTAEATAEPTVIVAPEADATGENWLKTVVDFIGEHDLIWAILAGFAMYLLGKSVPQATIESLQRNAARTDTPIDDIVTALLAALNQGRLQPATPGGAVSSPNVFEDILDKNTNNPPIILPVPAPEMGFEDTFGAGFHQLEIRNKGDDKRLIQVPLGYTWRGMYQDFAGAVLVPPNVNTQGEYGTRFNLAHTAGDYDLSRQKSVNPPPGATCVVYLDYVARINTDVAGPLGTWLWWHLLVNDAVLGPPVALENGQNRALWEWHGKPGARLGFSLHVQYASAGDDSVVDVKAFGYATAVGESRG